MNECANPYIIKLIITFVLKKTLDLCFCLFQTGAYYAVTFVLLSLSLVLAAITNNIAKRAARLGQPPALLKKVDLIQTSRFLQLCAKPGCPKYDFILF